MAEMSGVVKQASLKVVALEQLVSVLKTQVKIAERRAGDAEVCSGWCLCCVRVNIDHPSCHLVAFPVLQHLACEDHPSV